jgi:hypothetical protein
MGGAGDDSGIPHASLLIEFAEAVLDPDEARIARARKAVAETMGEAALVDAAAVAGNFNAIDRVADSTGIPLEAEKAAMTEDFRRALGIDDFGKSQPGDTAAD